MDSVSGNRDDNFLKFLKSCQFKISQLEVVQVIVALIEMLSLTGRRSGRGGRFRR